MLKVPNIKGADNLHFVWDSGIYEFSGRQTLPFRKHDWDKYTRLSQKIRTEFPIDDTKLKPNNPSEWALEDMKLAPLVYSNIRPG